MQAVLAAELKVAQRVPSLLVLNPTQSLQDLHLQSYEVLTCEPLHDYKGHEYNLLQELPLLLAPPLKNKSQNSLKQLCKKDKVSGVLLPLRSISNF